MQKSHNDLRLMGENGMRLVANKYDMKAVGSSVKEMYTKIINKN